MIDLLMIIQWLTALLTGGISPARRNLVPAMARTSFPCRAGSRFMVQADNGWMTMRLDPIPRVRVSSGPAPVQDDRGGASLVYASW